MHLLVSGGTGLIGSLALRHAIGHGGIDRITALGRRPASLDSPQLSQIACDFASLDAVADRIQPADAAICALGTTMRQAGSRQAFHAVDHDAVIAFARLAKAKGVRRFAIVSSIGASSRSGSFYLSTKGRAEDRLGTIGFERLVILQPSFLLGDRNEKRSGEGYATALAQLLSPLLAGPLRRYRPIEADLVARALLRAVTDDGAAAGRFDYDGIRRLAA